MSERSIVWDLISRDHSSAANDRVGRSFERLDARTSNLGATMGRVARGAALLGAPLLAAGTYAVKGGIQTLAALQTTQTGFTTLLGSAQKANDYLAWMKKFAVATPFRLEGLTDSSRMLLGVGATAKQSQAILQDYGDTAGAVGLDQERFQLGIMATSKAISGQRFTLGEMTEMMKDGFPIFKLMSEATGKNAEQLRKLASAGKLNTDVVMPKLLAQMHKDYGGTMEKQSQTLTGLWGTLQDTIDVTMANTLQPLVPFLTHTLSGAIKGVGTVLGSLPGDFRKVQEVGRDLHLDSLFKDLTARPKFSLDPQLVTKGGWIAQGAAKIKKWAQPLIDGLTDGVKHGNWNAFGQALGTTIGHSVTGLGGFVVQGAKNVDWEQKGSSVGKQALPFAIGFVAHFFDGLVSVARHHPWDTVVAILSLIPIGRVVGAVGERLGPGLTGGILRGFSKITAKWIEKPVFKVIGFLGTAFKDGFEHAFPALESDARALIQKGIVETWYHYTAVKEAGVKLIHDAVEAVGSRVGWGVRELMGYGGSVARALGHALSSEASMVERAAVGLVIGAATGATREGRKVVGEMGSIAHEIVGGLVHGIGREAGAVVSEAEHLVSGIPGAVKKILDIHSPSRVMAKIGSGVTEGLVMGIRGGRSELKKSMGELKDDLGHALSHWDDVLDSQKSKLSDLKSSYRDLKASVHDAFAGTSIVDRGSDLTDVLASYTTDIAQTRTASGLLLKLRKAGLKNSLLQQLAAGGTSSISLEQSILAAGSGGISRLNYDDGALSALGNAAGNTVANGQYASAISAETRRVSELTRATRDLQKEIKLLRGDIKHPGTVSSVKLRSELYRVLRQAGSLAGG